MKVQLSQLFQAVSGKFGNSVAFKGKSGFVVRRRVIPRNPQSPAQTVERNLIFNLSKGFKSLSTSDIAAWNAAAKSITLKGIYGDKFHQSGLNLYIKQNEALTSFGKSLIDTPVIIYPSVTPLTLTNIDPGSDVQSFKIYFDRETVAGEQTIIYATPQISAGVSSFKGKFVQLCLVSGPSTTFISGYDILADYVARFGTLNLNMKLAVFAVHSTASEQVTKYKAGPELDAIVS